jgi:Lon protease-like protein
MSEKVEMPLFPLNVVLFPDSKLPLYIFEERYKKMINECIYSKGEFGINLFAEKKMYMTGCSAIVNEVINKTETGEMNIVTMGIKRYHVINYDFGPEGFCMGKIEFIEIENRYYDKSKMNECVRMYNELVDAVYKEKVKKIDLNDSKWQDSSRSVSFSIAEKSGLNLFERQHLLEINNEDSRLDYILNYFKEVMPKIKEAGRINKIIKSDGYIQ